MSYLNLNFDFTFEGLDSLKNHRRTITGVQLRETIDKRRFTPLTLEIKQKEENSSTIRDRSPPPLEFIHTYISSRKEGREINRRQIFNNTIQIQHEGFYNGFSDIKSQTKPSFYETPVLPLNLRTAGFSAVDTLYPLTTMTNFGTTKYKLILSSLLEQPSNRTLTIDSLRTKKRISLFTKSEGLIFRL